MRENIWKGKWKVNIGGMKEWETTWDDEIYENEIKLEKLSDLLQEDGDWNDDSDWIYTLFELTQ